MSIPDQKIFRTGDIIKLYSQTPEEYQLKPCHVYSVEYNKFEGPYLTEQHPFVEPKNFLYKDEKFHTHILKSFRANNFNCGVLLTGQKGQGKSVSAKKLANVANLPILLINKFNGEFDLISFLNAIPCEYVLMIDEFEKIFPTDKSDSDTAGAQGIFLSFLDGTNVPKYKKLVVLTSNNQISEFFMNRPGRIRFKKEYRYIDPDFYHSIIDRFLIYPEHKDDLVRHLSPRDATVDLVRAIVEEINLLNQPYSSFRDIFNFTPSKFSYTVHFYEEDAETGYPWKFKEVFDLDYQITTSAEGIDGLPGNYCYAKFIRQDDKGIYLSLRRSYVDTDTAQKLQIVNKKISQLIIKNSKSNESETSNSEIEDIVDLDVVAGTKNTTNNNSFPEPIPGVPMELILQKDSLQKLLNEDIIVRFSESTYSASAYQTENKFRP